MKLAPLAIVFVASAAGPSGVPWTTVKRGDVTFTVTARGDLQEFP